MLGALLSQAVINLAATDLLAAGLSWAKLMSKLALIYGLMKWSHFLGSDLSEC